MKSWSVHVTRTQWLLGGSLLAVYVLVRLTPNPGTPWQSVSGLSFSHDGKKLAIGVYSGYFRQMHERWYFADLDHTVAVAVPGPSGALKVLSHRQLVQKAGIVNMLPRVLIGPSVAFSPDGRLLVAVGFEGLFNIWDVDNGRLVRQQSLEKPHIRTFASIPGRNAFVVAFRRWASIRDFEEPQERKLMEATMNIQVAVPSPDGKQLALAGFKPLQIQLWDTNTETLLRTYRSPIDVREGIASMAYTPDGKTLVAANDVNIEVIDAGTLKQTACIPERLVLGLAISPDGEHLATARYDGVTLWNLPKRQKTPLHWNVPPAESVQFSPDGQWLAAGSSDGCVRLWNVRTGELVASWRFRGPASAAFLFYFKFALVLAWTSGMLLYARQAILRHWPWVRNFRF